MRKEVSIVFSSTSTILPRPGDRSDDSSPGRRATAILCIGDKAKTLRESGGLVVTDRVLEFLHVHRVLVLFLPRVCPIRFYV